MYLKNSLNLIYRQATLTQEQKCIFGALKSLVGYTTHKSIRTDPIDPSAWWRTYNLPVVNDVSDEDEEESRPPGDDLNVMLIDVVERNRGPSGRIRWKSCIQEFERITGHVCMLNQLKNRYHTITRK